MEKTLLPYQHLKIQLEEIISATNNFHPSNLIGAGGFGPVYRGEVYHTEGRSMVAIKRLDPKYGQGAPEFLKEITMLFTYRHENIISLVGFCCEGSEMILVYKLASRGSLDKYLNSPDLTWTQRLKVCLDAAKGISYLHDPREKHQRLIHCDIKSGNILLDDQWNSRVSDFGLSIMGSANEQQSVIVSLAAGTEGYIDPQYRMTNTLTKESDVYSFGVVLFEVLCGRSCCIYKNHRVEKIFVPTWLENYNQKNLKDIIFKNPTILPLDESALETFSDIAYRCLKVSREDRPNMAEVLTELDTALQLQVFSECDLLVDYKEMTKSAEPPLNYISKVEFMKLLRKGALLNGGNTYFSLNKKGEHCEMIRFEECVDLDSSLSECYTKDHDNFYSIFGERVLKSRDGKFDTNAKTQFLTPGITYTVNLVFKFHIRYDIKWERRCAYIGLRYKLEGETQEQISHFAYEREDGWFECELCQFTSDQRIVDIKILFVSFHGIITYSSYIAPDCIEFRPLEKESRIYRPDMAEVVTALESQEYSDWKPPFEYEEMIKTAQPPLNYRSNSELRKLLSKPVLLNYGKTWFSLNKKGEHCEMIPIAEYSDLDPSEHYESERKISRFSQRRPYYIGYECAVKTRVETHFLSPGTEYKMYLVFKFMCPVMKVEAKCHDLIFLKYKLYGLEKTFISYIADEREDGWWNCELNQFTCESNYNFEIQFDGFCEDNYTMIEAVGIEFLPLEKVEHKPVLSSDANWEVILPAYFKDMTISSSYADWKNYEDIMRLLKQRVKWTTKKELYELMHGGFKINDDKEWFSLDKNGKKCYMISAKAMNNGDMDIYVDSVSRFGTCGEIISGELNINIKTEALLLPSQTTYAVYLVYRLRECVSYYNAHMKVLKEDDGELISNTLMLSPLINQVIKPEANQNPENRVYEGFPQKRDDGWMEVQIYEFESLHKYTPIQLSPEIRLQISSYHDDADFDGILIEGVEFRPKFFFF